MKLASLVFLACAALSAPFSVAAQTSNLPRYMIYGPGANSCGTWTTAAKSGSSQDVLNKIWLQGFITAVNNFYLTNLPGVTADLLEGTDIDGANAWVDNYCAAHPLVKLAAAAQALTVELTDKWLSAHSIPSGKR